MITRSRFALAVLSTALLSSFAWWRPVTAQTRYTYQTGQSVSPAFEGWWPNEDGSFTLFFGYMNSNWLEEFDIAIGPDNNLEPGVRIKDSRRTSIPAAIRSCSRFGCRRISKNRK